MVRITLFATFVAAVCILQKADATESSCRIKGKYEEYSYDPTTEVGPENWGSIMPDFEACGTGNIQSPINFPTNVNYASLEDGPLPTLHQSAFHFKSKTSNWALECVSEGSCGHTMFGEKNFTLVNVHFHSPSEHTLNGTRYPLESHYVHASEDGDFAVIATMYNYYQEGDYTSDILSRAHVDVGQNPMVKQIMTGIYSEHETFDVAPGTIIDANKGYCMYTGSLTTPPCTEGVTFFMSMNVATVSKRQVYDYSISAGASYDGNNRPVQPLNGRDITCYV